MVNLRKITSLFVCIIMLVLLFPCAVTAEGNTYYVDSVNGNDNNNGRTPVGAWKNLSKVNGITLSAGDRVCLKSGSVWNGQFLIPKGSGTAAQPIVIESYGEGAKPAIHANGKASAAVSLLYVQGYEIRDLELTNDSGSAEKYCRGLYVETGNTNSREYFNFTNLYVHNINGILTDHLNGGIIMRGYATDSSLAEFHQVTIENCIIENTARNGIRVVGQSSRGSSGVVIRGNVLSKIAGDGIVTIGTDGALIEHNIASDCFYRYKEMPGVACVAIWTYGSDRTVVQYNEAYATHSTSDGEGFDSDYNCTDSLFQYNYSHDNDGGFMLICNNPVQAENFNTGTVVRYNISRNDKNSGIMLSGNPTDAQIYNNTVYIGEGVRSNPVNTYAWNGGHASNIKFYNNIFYNLGSGDFSMGATENYEFDSNLFYGGSAEKRPKDSNAVTADPCFSDTNGGVDLAGFQLRKESPCIDAGITISDNGGKDYFGTALSDGMTDIGAAEYFGEKLPNPTPEPERKPMYTAEFEEVLFESDFANEEEWRKGITVVNGTWTSAQDSAGQTCIRGVLDSGSAVLVVGEDDWSDYTAEVKFRLVQDEKFALSKEEQNKNTISAALYTGCGNPPESGTYVKYMLRNPAYYNNYFGGYVKKPGGKPEIIENNFCSGENEAASLVRNKVQTLTVAEKNSGENGSAQTSHSIEFSNGGEKIYTAQKEEKRNGEPLRGRVGIEFKNETSGNVLPMYVEIYSIKITTRKSFLLAYTDGDANIQTIPPNADVVVQGELCGTGGGLTVLTAVYHYDRLFDLQMRQISGAFSYSVHTPENTSDCALRTFLWHSVNGMIPLTEAFVFR